MKKIIYLVFLTTTIIFAQDSGKIEVGATVGGNFASVTDEGMSSDFKFGLNAGITGEYYFSETWGIKTKILYHQKGWGNGFVFNEDTGEESPSDFRLNYITIAPMANWHFGSTKRWYLNFGPFVGFLMSAEAEINGMDIKDVTNSIDFGLSYDIGYKFPVGDRTKLFVEIGGQSGLSDISEKDSGDESISVNTVTGTINVGVLITL